VLQWLASDGVPIVLAHKRRGHAFSLEPQWQHTKPGLENYYRWLNGVGDMLAVITGHVYDVFDFDVQNKGLLDEFLAYAAEKGMATLKVQAISQTPSGGFHLYVNTLGKRKVPIALGIDYQGKNGIAFIPPSRKLSKTSEELIPYKWLEFAPGDADDGEAIYDLLLKWPNHRPKLSHSGKAVDHSKLTQKQIDDMRQNGVPNDENHDTTLALLVWQLCLQRKSEEEAYGIWLEVVERTDEKNGKRPYEERDFIRHWRGAEFKLKDRDDHFDLILRNKPGARVLHGVAQNAPHHRTP